MIVDMKKKPAKKPAAKTTKKPSKAAVLCEICDAPIPAARLEVFPHITYCVKCSETHHLAREILPDDVCDVIEIDSDIK